MVSNQKPDPDEWTLEDYKAASDWWHAEKEHRLEEDPWADYPETNLPFPPQSES